MSYTEDQPYPTGDGHWRVPGIDVKFPNYASANKRRMLEQIKVEVETGLIDDSECAKRLDDIGATEDDLDAIM